MKMKIKTIITLQVELDTNSNEVESSQQVAQHGDIVRRRIHQAIHEAYFNFNGQNLQPIRTKVISSSTRLNYNSIHFITSEDDI